MGVKSSKFRHSRSIGCTGVLLRARSHPSLEGGEVVERAHTGSRRMDRRHGSSESLIPGLPIDELAFLCLARVSRSSIPVLKAVCKSWKEAIEDGGVLEVRDTLDSSEDWIYTVEWGPEESDGHHARLWAFDCCAASWKDLGILPPMEGVVPSSRMVAVGQTLIFLGGAKPLDDFERFFPIRQVWRYDVMTGQARRASSMLTPRDRFACAVIGGHLYVAGGVGAGFSYAHNMLQSAEVYDLEADTWQALPSLPGGPTRMATLERQGAAFEGKFVVRGSWMEGQLADVYDPQEGTWTTLPDFFPEKAGAPYYTSFYSCPGGMHFVEFGEDHRGCIQTLDGRTGRWGPSVQLPVGGTAPSVAVAVVRGQVYVVGGEPSDPEILGWRSTRVSLDEVRGPYKLQSQPCMHVLAPGAAGGAKWRALCAADPNKLPRTVRGCCIVRV